MEISFFLDAKLIEKEGKYYTSGAVTREYLNKHRFSDKDTLVVVTRKEKNVQLEKEMSISSDKNIKFITFNSYKEAWKKRESIKKVVLESQLVYTKLPASIGMIAMHYILKYDKKHIVEMVGCPYDSLNNYGSILGKILAPIMYFINRYYVKKAQNVMYVTDKFLQKRYPNKNNNIGCSDVNIENIDEIILNKRLKKISKFNKNNTIKIGLIGSLNVNYKGHEIAFKSISKLKDKYDIELHLLGTGNKEKWSNLINKLNIKDNIYFDGTLPSGESVYKWIDELDIYIMPSLLEGLPRALVEAMSRGCPCIGTKTGGIIELLPNEMMIKKKDFKDLTQKIEKILNNKDLMEKCAIQNFNKSKEYLKDNLAKKRNYFYNKILEEINNEKSSTCSK